MVERLLGFQKSEAMRRQPGSEQMEAGLPALCFTADQPAATATHGGIYDCGHHCNTGRSLLECRGGGRAKSSLIKACGDFGVKSCQHHGMLTSLGELCELLTATRRVQLSCCPPGASLHLELLAASTR